MTNVTPLIPLATQIVPEDHINLTRISELLNAAYLDHTLEDEGDIYVNDAIEFPLWIALNEDSKRITLFTFIEPDSDASANWFERVNELNSTIILPQFSYRDGRLVGRYYLTYDGGLNVRHFIKMMRRFAGAFRAAAYDDIHEAAKSAAAWENEERFEPSPKL